MNMKEQYVVICKGHLACLEDKCLRCRISKDNEDARCYKPVLLNRDYFGQKEIREINRDKEVNKSSLSCEDFYDLEQLENWVRSKIDPIDYYDCGQEQERHQCEDSWEAEGK